MANLDQRAAEILARRQGAVQVERPTTDERAAAILAAREAPTEAVQTPDGATPQVTPRTSSKGLRGGAPTVDPDSISSTLGRGVQSAVENVGGTAEALGQALDSQFLQDAGSQLRAEAQEEALKFGTPTNTTSIYNVESLGDAAEWAQENIVGSLPSMAPTVAGAVAGGRFGGPVGAAVGGMLGSLGINIGDVQNRMLELDPDAKSPWTSIATGAGMSALDGVGAASILKPFIRTLGEGVVYQNLVKQGLAKGAAIDLIKGAAAEGLTEAAQEALAAGGAAAGTGTDIDIDQTVEAMVNAALAGSMLGGAARVATGVHERVGQNDLVAGSSVPEIQASTDTSKEGLAGRVWNALGGHATSKLEGLANASPLAREFVENFRADMTGRTASKETIYESGDLMAGKWRTQLNEGTKDWDDARWEAAIEAASTPGAFKNNPDAALLRSVMDDVHSTAKQKGLDDIGYIEGHFPFRLNREAMAANPDQFIQDITPYFKDRGAAEKAYNDYLAQEARLDNPDLAPTVKRQVEKDANGEWVIAKPAQKGGDAERARYRFAQGDTIPEFGHLERTRAFAKVPQNVLNKYAVEQTTKDRVNAVKDYFEGAAHRLAFTERFGADGSKANAQILKIVKDAQSKGREVPKAEVDRMYDLLDAYSGTLGRISDPTLKTAQSTLGAVLTMKTLPLAALSSLTEFMTPAIRGDIGIAMRSVAPTIQQMAKDLVRPISKAPRTEFSQLAAEANISFEAATSVASERLGANIFSKGAAKANRAFFIANGLSLLTHITRVYAAKTADQLISRNLSALAQGLPPTSAVGRKYSNQLRSMGIDISSQAEARALLTPSTPSEIRVARDARKLGIKRFADQSVLETNLSNTPLWMNEPKMGMLAMLKRYPAAFGNTILPQLARRFSPSYAGSHTQAASALVGSSFILGMMLAIGYAQDELKQIAKNGEFNYDDTRSEAQRFADVLNTVAMPLQGSMVIDFFASPRYGSDPVSTTLGPAAGMAKDVVTGTYQTITQFEENPTAGIIGQTLLKQTPIRPFKWATEYIMENE